jgi:hypothetical protein
MYFPNRDELSFRLVLAFPNDSRIVFDWISTFFTLKFESIFSAHAGSESTKSLLPFDIILRVGIRYSCDVLHDDFRCLGLASAGLAAYHDASVLVLLFYDAISSIGNGIDVRWILEKLSTLVFVDEFVGIDVHGPVGIHRNGDFADVGVNFSCLVSAISKREFDVNKK